MNRGLDITKNIEEALYRSLSSVSARGEGTSTLSSFIYRLVRAQHGVIVVRHRSTSGVNTSSRKESAAVFAGGHWFPSNGPTTFDGSCPAIAVDPLSQEATKTVDWTMENFLRREDHIELVLVVILDSEFSDSGKLYMGKKSDKR
ncbi:hypothetical protein [Absidia glauca]|uniref:Uncharacterized protein n=1 Tax=Absidia glauca TaxID=4829 RepID=A0A168RWA0_ABSGL|nr:hypothetical protein [Absidia glauca]